MKKNPQLYNSQHSSYSFVIVYIVFIDWKLGLVMAVILTDNERDEILDSKKTPINKIVSILLKPKSGTKHREFQAELMDTKKREYRMIIRKNTIDQFDFSIILRYLHRDAKKWRTITRYNGCHVHVNKLERKKIECFHIHKITEKYQNANFKGEGYAELTEFYSNYDSALGEFLRNNNIKGMPFMPTLTNWDEREGMPQ